MNGLTLLALLLGFLVVGIVFLMDEHDRWVAQHRTPGPGSTDPETDPTR